MGLPSASNSNCCSHNTYAEVLRTQQSNNILCDRQNFIVDGQSRPQMDVCCHDFNNKSRPLTGSFVSSQAIDKDNASALRSNTVAVNNNKDKTKGKRALGKRSNSSLTASTVDQLLQPSTSSPKPKTLMQPSTSSPKPKTLSTALNTDTMDVNRPSSSSSAPLRQQEQAPVPSDSDATLRRQRSTAFLTAPSYVNYSFPSRGVIVCNTCGEHMDSSSIYSNDEMSAALRAHEQHRHRRYPSGTVERATYTINRSKSKERKTEWYRHGRLEAVGSRPPTKTDMDVDSLQEDMLLSDQIALRMHELRKNRFDPLNYDPAYDKSCVSAPKPTPPRVIEEPASEFNSDIDMDESILSSPATDASPLTPVSAADLPLPMIDGKSSMTARRSHSPSKAAKSKAASSPLKNSHLPSTSPAPPSRKPPPRKSTTTASTPPASQKPSRDRRTRMNCMTPAAREERLRADPWCDVKNPALVRCKACNFHVKLDSRNGASYYAGLWIKHRNDNCRLLRGLYALWCQAKGVWPPPKERHWGIVELENKIAKLEKLEREASAKGKGTGTGVEEEMKALQEKMDRWVEESEEKEGWMVLSRGAAECDLDLKKKGKDVYYKGDKVDISAVHLSSDADGTDGAQPGHA